MHTRLRGAIALAALMSFAACGGGSGGGAGIDCPASAIRHGIGLDVAAPLAANVGTATLTACWADSCQTPAIDLFDSTTTVQTTCEGTGPDAACAARSEPDGGKTGFVDLKELPASTVSVSVTLRDSSGTTLVDQAVEVTPAITYPHGPECGGGTPQARLTVAADGTVTVVS